MRLAMHNWMRVEPLETTIARLARYGYDSIEINGELEQWDVGDTRRLLDEYGVSCWGVVPSMFGTRSLVAASEQDRASSVAYVKACARFLADTGGEVLMLIPGTIGVVIPTSDPDDEWRWLVESTTEINDFARSVGVRVAVEPINRFETYVINRIDQALALCDAVGDDVGVAVDTFHMNIEEDDLYAAISRAGSRILDVHVADNNRMPAGLGSIDWERVLKSLEEVGYDGPLAAEFVANVDRTPANRYPGALETDLDKLDIDPMQRQFIIDHGSTILTESFYDWMTKMNAQYLRGLG